MADTELNDSQFEKCEADLCHTAKIQGLGALCWINRKNWQIQYVSENTKNFIADHLSLLGNNAFDALPARVTNLFDLARNNHPIETSLTNCTAIVTALDSSVLVELEPLPLTANFDQKLPVAPPADSIEEIMNWVLKEMLKTSGYKRSLLYRFNTDHSGEVIGEHYEDEGERFIGLRYPATDIPKVARDLYKTMPLRYIHDTKSEPISMVGLSSLDKHSLNLSQTYLREVSPFHIKYLQNMGVIGSLSIPILRQDQLWGLFSLHADEATFVDIYKRKHLIELMKVYKNKLIYFENQERMNFLDKFKMTIKNFMVEVLDWDTKKASFIADAKDLFKCDEVYIYNNGKLCCSGQSDRETFDFIEEVLLQNHDGIYHTDSIKEGFRVSSNLAREKAGLLSISIYCEKNDYSLNFIFFRHEVLKEVTWGSKVEFYPGDENPINSFGRWKTQVEYHSTTWDSRTLIAAQELYNQGKLTLKTLAHSGL